MCNAFVNKYGPKILTKILFLFL
ncbi:MAG: hypothetical protein IKW50_05820 [Oscillospiraceae bacterium]|nr:hypothetical protein [Oscillospiraceae bacterium]